MFSILSRTRSKKKKKKKVKSLLYQNTSWKPHKYDLAFIVNFPTLAKLEASMAKTDKHTDELHTDIAT